MTRQRWHLLCPDAHADALEAACDVQITRGWLRLARGAYQRAGVPMAVASLQATDDESARLAAIVALTPGVVAVRGPDDDGPRQADRLVDVGDTVPAMAASARYTWRRAMADAGLEAVARPVAETAAEVSVVVKTKEKP